MFIDTHCHLTDEYTDVSDLDTVIKRAFDNGVEKLICPCANPIDIDKAIAIINKYENIYATIGIHPEFANKFPENDITNIKNHTNNDKVVGIGEIGLDYHYSSDDKIQQIELFERQIKIAIDSTLPIAVHTRDAEIDTAQILNNNIANLLSNNGGIPGVMHCFTSSWGLAKKMLDRGFYFSASGIITFKNSDDLRETFSKIPIDRIVIETDSPYCAPIPYRGKKCEPAFVIETAKVLADIKNLQISDLESILKNNTKNLYPKLGIK